MVIILMDKPCRGSLPTVKNGQLHSTLPPESWPARVMSIFITFRSITDGVRVGFL
jgi:hypothetical protein